MMAKLYSGTYMSLKLSDICLTGEKTYPDRGSNPCPLRDNGACYLLYRGGQLPEFYNFNNAFVEF